MADRYTGPPWLDRRWVRIAYGVFTAYAALFAGLSGGRDRVWAIWAVGGYGIAALLLWRARGRAGSLAVAVGVSIALALVAPLLWNSVAFPLEDGINVIDRSAELLAHHGSPYLPASQVTGWISYNPYLPLMAASGLPWVAAFPGLFGNAGVWLAIATLVVLCAAFLVAAPAGPRRRRYALICTGLAAASPVIALNLAVITTDPPVLAFILLSVALAAAPDAAASRDAAASPDVAASPDAAPAPRARRVLWSGAALAAACVLKDTAWLAIPVMIALYWSRDGRRAAARFTGALLVCGLLLIAVLAPATLVHLSAMKAMIRDTVLFPLGLTKYKTPAESLLPGHLLTELGTAGHVLSVGLLLAAGLAVAVSLFIRPLRDTRAAALRMAIGLTLMFALGPQVRFGYFLYPLGLIGWLYLTAPAGPVRVAGTERPVGPPALSRRDLPQSPQKRTYIRAADFIRRRVVH